MSKQIKLYTKKCILSKLKLKQYRLRWQSRRTQSLCLPTTRAPTRCWWGTLTPEGTGGTPEQTGRTWGAVKGEEKWRSDGTGALEGWLVEGRGSHTRRDHSLGVRRIGGEVACCVPCPLGPQEACWAPRPGPPPSKDPSSRVGPRGVGGRGGRRVQVNGKPPEVPGMIISTPRLEALRGHSSPAEPKPHPLSPQGLFWLCEF